MVSKRLHIANHESLVVGLLKATRLGTRPLSWTIATTFRLEVATWHRSPFLIEMPHSRFSLARLLGLRPSLCWCISLTSNLTAGCGFLLNNSSM